MRATKWGILGAANIALERVIPAMHASASARAYAIGSRNFAKAEEAARRGNIERAYGSYMEVLEDPAVEAVYIPLPNNLHVEWSIRALEAGKHVLCEKPLCLSSAEVRQLIEAQERSGRQLEEALAYRNHPQWRRIEQLVDEEAIGRPIAVQGTIAKRFLDPKDIRNKPDGGGGAAYDLGIYVISACNMVFKRGPIRVTAAIDRDPQFGIDRLTTVLLDYGDAHATLTASSQGGTEAWATHQQFSVLGSHGWLRSTFPYAQARPIECRLEVGNLTSVGANATASEYFPPVNQYELQLDRFSRLAQGEAVRSWPLQDALVSIAVIESLFIAAREAKWVEVEI
ncbi:MAG TPA: Gfo/Idh/MocA family oxidoreductase [Xanthobacteraceae bacterium]|nr:Gfo/Idh/MocA family oxidoreductase [Xanthobacteraceae bacterium]